MMSREIEAYIQDGKPVMWLGSNSSSGRNLLALGSTDQFRIEKFEEKHLAEFQAWLDNRNSWVFGCLAYDVKNGIESLRSDNKEIVELPDLVFFRPEHVLELTDNWKVLDGSIDVPQKDWRPFSSTTATTSVEMKPEIT
ncbi:MAG: hypothetical protein HKN32_07660, partial [Flavobacteriales bacterium]|nr:hypothetical protein [Flavobacteriales bacterium]